MLFSSADYPLFLAAVFFLYGLARAGAWPGVVGRWALMIVLADLVYLLLTKDTGALWDPLGGCLYRLLGEASSVADRLPAWPPWWHYVVGVGVVVGGARLGYRHAGALAGARLQRWLGLGIVVALAAIGVLVIAGVRADVLPAITAAFARYGHLGFLAALAIALGAGARPQGRTFARVVILFLVSCVFYHAWAAARAGAYQYMLALLLGTIVLDYYLALWIARTADPIARRVLLVVSLVSNLGILGVFKYYDFFTQDLLHLPVGPLHLVLPAGISFHTFQSMSYTVDVYRRRLAPTTSVLQFATFVLFFPQLVAGPIVRATELLPQLAEPPPYDYARAADGVFRIVLGLFKKIALADFLAIALVDRVFTNPERYSSVEVLVGVYAYALQIYLDFSAYSDIAIGSAQLLGFELPENFRTPYRSANLQEFWRRWHISLSSWLRDYLYIPLGGSRGGGFATYRNLIITMLLGGLWHGARWTYIVWGALHGLGLAATRVFQRMLDEHRSLDRALVGCLALAGFGLVLHYTVLARFGVWFDLIAAWVYLVPFWALATVALSAEPPVVARPRAPRPELALALRLAMIAAVGVLALALAVGPSGAWLPILAAPLVLAALADAAEVGIGRGELAGLAETAAKRVFATLLVFHYVCLAWVFFRAETFDQALAILERVASGETDAPNLIPAIVFAVAAGVVAHVFSDRTLGWVKARFVALGPIEQAGLLVAAAFLLRELSHPTIVPFIYFEF